MLMMQKKGMRVVSTHNRPGGGSGVELTITVI